MRFSEGSWFVILDCVESSATNQHWSIHETRIFQLHNATATKLITNMLKLRLESILCLQLQASKREDEIPSTAIEIRLCTVETTFDYLYAHRLNPQTPTTNQRLNRAQPQQVQGSEQIPTTIN